MLLLVMARRTTTERRPLPTLWPQRAKCGCIGWPTELFNWFCLYSAGMCRCLPFCCGKPSAPVVFEPVGLECKPVEAIKDFEDNGDVFIVLQFRVIFRSQFSNVFFPLLTVLNWSNRPQSREPSRRAQRRNEWEKAGLDATLYLRFVGPGTMWDKWKLINLDSTWQMYSNMTRHDKTKAPPEATRSEHEVWIFSLRNDRTMIGTLKIMQIC